MKSAIAAVAVAMSIAVSGCSTIASSNVVAAAAMPAWQGPVFVSPAPLPAGIDHKVLGSVQADARAGYDSASTLYPLLAAEAKKIGANAVINAQGGRRVTAFSWAAPYVGGIAVRVENPDKLKSLSGSYHLWSHWQVYLYLWRLGWLSSILG